MLSKDSVDRHQKVLIWMWNKRIFWQVEEYCRKEGIEYKLCSSEEEFFAEIERKPRPTCIILEYTVYEGGFGRDNYGLYEDLATMPITVLMVERGRNDSGEIFVALHKSKVRVSGKAIERLVVEIDRICEQEEERENSEEPES